MGKKILVAYFSCSGTTRSAAINISEITGADLYEIKPQKPYTKADLDWRNINSRSTIEVYDPACRTALADKNADIKSSQIIFIGYPIWLGMVPPIIKTFLESYDFSEKTIIPFATSGGSGMGETEECLKALCSKKIHWMPGKLLNGISKESLAAWIASMGL